MVSVTIIRSQKYALVVMPPKLIAAPIRVVNPAIIAACAPLIKQERGLMMMVEPAHMDRFYAIVRLKDMRGSTS